MRRHLLVVLGMHRSGNSALAAMIARAAAAPRNDFAPADPGGAAESHPVVRFNDRLLAQLGARWDSIASLPPDWPALPSVAALRSEAAELLAAQSGNGELAVLNDPRLCRLLPFWHDVFADSDFAPSFALLVRRPAEIAASLARRNQFAPEKSLALWLSHVGDAERDTRRQARALFSYDDLLADPGGMLDRIRRELSLPLRPTKAEREAACAIVRPELKRERREAADPRTRLASGLDAVLDDAYARMLGAAGKDPFAVIATLPTTARTAVGTAIPPWLAGELALAQLLTRSFVAEVDATRCRVAELAQQLDAARAEAAARDEAENAMRGQIARAERDLADERATIAALAEEIDRAQRDASDQQQQKAAADAHIEELGEALASVRDVVLTQQRDLDAARETIDALVADAATLRTNAKDRERAIEALGAKLEAHARQLEDGARREAALLAELNGLRDEATALRGERDTLAPALRDSQQAQELLSADRDRLARLERDARERSALLDGRIAALTGDIQALRTRVEANSAELARLSGKWYVRVARRLARPT